mmetsp:Transcript_51994/g.138473  ORF Transcript_51994/g.138473 Transcript_51994/m.138473 type:complete len:222 (+) Transcript_51994:280-945(+)
MCTGAFAGCWGAGSSCGSSTCMGAEPECGDGASTSSPQRPVLPPTGIGARMPCTWRFSGMPRRSALRRMAAPGDIVGDGAGEGAASRPWKLARGPCAIPEQRRPAPTLFGKKADEEVTIGVTGDHGDAGAVDAAIGEPSCEQCMGDSSSRPPKCTRAPAFGVGSSRQGAPLACTAARLAFIAWGSEAAMSHGERAGPLRAGAGQPLAGLAISRWARAGEDA